MRRKTSIIIMIAFFVLSLSVSYFFINNELKGFLFGFDNLDDSNINQRFSNVLSTGNNLGSGSSSTSISEIKVLYSFEEPQLIESNGYQTIKMSGLDLIGQEGEPLVPVKPIQILMPLGSELTGYEIRSEQKIILSGSYQLKYQDMFIPLLPEGELIAMGYDLEREVKKQEAYESMDKYPEMYNSEPVRSVQKGYVFINMNLFPVEYIPKIGQVSYYKELEVVLQIQNIDRIEKSFRNNEKDQEEIFFKRFNKIVDQELAIEDLSTAIKNITYEEDEIKPDILDSYSKVSSQMMGSSKTKNEEIFKYPQLDFQESETLNEPVMMELIEDPTASYITLDESELMSTSGIVTHNLFLNEPIGLSNLPNTECEYMIITIGDFKDDLQVLADYKMNRSELPLSSCVVLYEDIMSDNRTECNGPWDWDNTCGVGQLNDGPARIRNFIRYGYSVLNTQYILLAGDADMEDIGNQTEEVLIPVRYLYPSGASYARLIPSDMYYSNLDGTFDEDNDGVFGENLSELDLNSEVFVGRIPVDNQSEINNYISKVIYYEQSLKSAEPLMVGEHLGFGGVAEYATASLEEMRLGSINHGYDTVGFYPNYDPGDISILYDAPNDIWPKLELYNLLNNGKDIINHLGHADNTYVMKMNNSDLGNIANLDPFFIYSQGCYPGAFDNLNSSGNVISHDSIAEHLLFLPANRGAFAVMMNSRYGWGMRNSTDGPSQWFARWFFDGQFNSTVMNKSLGALNSYSHEQNNWRIEGGSNMAKFVMYETNILGDPELKLNLTNTISNNFSIEIINNSLADSGFDVDANISGLTVGSGYNYSLEVGHFDDYDISWINQFKKDGQFIPSDSTHFLDLDPLLNIELLEAGYVEGYYFFKITVQSIDNLSHRSVKNVILHFVTKNITSGSTILNAGDSLDVSGQVFVGDQYEKRVNASIVDLFHDGEDLWGLEAHNQHGVYKYDEDFSVVYEKYINLNSSWSNEDFFFDGIYWWVLDGVTNRVYKYDSDFNYLGVSYSLSETLEAKAIYRRDNYWYVVGHNLAYKNKYVYRYDLDWNYTGVAYSHSLISTSSPHDIFFDGVNWILISESPTPGIVIKFDENWNYISTGQFPNAINLGITSLLPYENGWIASTRASNYFYILDASYSVNVIPFEVEYNDNERTLEWSSSNITMLNSFVPISSAQAIFNFNSTDVDDGKYIFRLKYYINNQFTYDDIDNFYIQVKNFEIHEPLSGNIYSKFSNGLEIVGSIYAPNYDEISIHYKETAGSTWESHGVTMNDDLTSGRQIDVLLGTISPSFLQEDTAYDIRIKLQNNDYIVERLISGLSIDSRLKQNFPINLTDYIDFDFFGGLWSDRVSYLLSADLNNDGKKELITIVKNILFVYDLDGELLPNFPVTLASQLGKFVIGDIDDDRNLEIIIITEKDNEDLSRPFLYAINDDGSDVPGFPINGSDFNYFTGDSYVLLQNSSLVVSDIDSDGKDEIIFGANSNDNLENSQVFVYEGNGIQKWNFVFEDNLDVIRNTMLASGDVDCDDQKEIVAVGNSKYVYVLNGSGELETKFETPSSYNAHGYLTSGTIPPKLINIDSDCKKEVFLGSNLGGYSAYLDIYGYDIDGTVDWYKGHVYSHNVGVLFVGIAHYLYDFSIQKIPEEMNSFNVLWNENYLYSTASDVNFNIVNRDTTPYQIPVEGGFINDLEPLTEINIHGDMEFLRGESTPVLIDLTGDNISEYVFHVGNVTNLGNVNRIYAFNMDGETIPGFPIKYPTLKRSFSWPNATPVVIDDLDYDGLLEVAVVSVSLNPMIYVWDLDIPKYNQIEWGGHQNDVGFTGEDTDISRLEDPIIIPKGGIYQHLQEVKIINSAYNVDIYYSIDGTTPTKDSFLYENPIIVFEDTIIKAKAYREGIEPSNLVQEDFLITDTTAFPVIKGSIYHDYDGNSVYNPLENDRIIPNLSINLYTDTLGSTAISEVFSDDDGLYQFGVLETGTYYISVDPKKVTSNGELVKLDESNIYTVKPQNSIQIIYNKYNLSDYILDIPLHSLNVDRVGVFGQDMYIGLGDFSKIVSSNHWEKNTLDTGFRYLDLDYDEHINLNDLTKIINKYYWEFPNN
jgi:hypothetical protein